jgi:hypothetical protein
MNRATEKAFEALARRSIAGVDIAGDTVELAIPDSEGWRLIITAAPDECGRPALTARWEPGLRRDRVMRPRRLLAHRRSRSMRRPLQVVRGTAE